MGSRHVSIGRASNTSTDIDSGAMMTARRRRSGRGEERGDGSPIYGPPSACTMDAARIGDTSAAIYGLQIALNSGRAALTRARIRCAARIEYRLRRGARAHGTPTGSTCLVSVHPLINRLHASRPRIAATRIKHAHARARGHAQRTDAEGKDERGLSTEFALYHCIAGECETCTN